MWQDGSPTWMPQIPLPEVLIAVAAIAVSFLMAEMGYLHHRGNFHRLPMYAPVVVPPFFVMSAFLLLLIPSEWTWWAFAISSGALVLLGLAGVFYHLQGVGRQTGGFNLDNVMVGPPLVAPLGFTLVGLLGLLALAGRGG